MNTRILLLVFSLLIFPLQKAISQSGISHEVGVVAGPLAFFSDYGQRENFETNIGNTGIGFGLLYFMNFTNRADAGYSVPERYFYDHFKIRGELDFHKTSFEHFGRWVADDQQSLFADQLRAMSGSTTVIDLGFQLEYFPFSLQRFEYREYTVSPFVSFGLHWSYFNPKVESSLGPLNTLISTPVKYFDSFQQAPGQTFSVVASAGMRYKLNRDSDLIFDVRWQNYFSNWVDGLNPDVPENKSNDWIFWVNVGYIYYLD
ncbi:hypothetical protein Aeqsu_1555 [Aequorivita sublithincola DSM 14238]|uniref:Glutamate dehydrogenase n=1 Tax=Aequorivita sublithincola (strain DSM 14238 / LMG 21431 / ACAM 643 / 9-3) TaxID=746697 RepID=I3YVM2_AEQSU|nr:hypothetical protein [Aequorivita sublithincola]AFL81040.1 hypothetical protein Aeqsu_1555 [Aequorivita sublithincola DSM 14238]